MWKYFGFVRNAEGVVKEDGFALCRLCLRKVAAKDGTTSNMLNHLRRHHEAEYEEVKVKYSSEYVRPQHAVSHATHVACLAHAAHAARLARVSHGHA